MCGGVCWVCLGACVCGVCVRSRGEKVSLAPLYYPDTLVNPDTCLGSLKCFKLFLFLFETLCPGLSVRKRKFKVFFTRFKF